jgi:hypothetical protein
VTLALGFQSFETPLQNQLAVPGHLKFAVLHVAPSLCGAVWPLDGKYMSRVFQHNLERFDLHTDCAVTCHVSV